MLLVAGCSQTTPGQATESTAASNAVSTPGPRAPIGDVIAFVEAGESADEADYHDATLSGDVHHLDNSIAFTTSTGAMRCATGETSYDLGLLSCVTELTDPPPKPTVVDGNWVSGWLDFPGDELTLGSVHGDPGIFSYGDGTVLPDGQSLTFGDYRCRAEKSAVYCVNYLHRSGFAFSDAGVLPFGCLRPGKSEIGGEQFRC